jgi:hypothetical protein
MLLPKVFAKENGTTSSVDIAIAKIQAKGIMSLIDNRKWFAALRKCCELSTVLNFSFFFFSTFETMLD